MAQSILVSSTRIKFYANDLLDKEIIEKGCFIPAYEYGSVSDSINEMVKIVKFTLSRK